MRKPSRPTKSLPPPVPNPEGPPPPPFLHPLVRCPQPTPDLRRHRTGRRHPAPLAGRLARARPSAASAARDGEPLPNVLCALLVWPLLKVKSLHCFCAELCQILAGQVSVLYDFLGREDINWRGSGQRTGPQSLSGQRPGAALPARLRRRRHQPGSRRTQGRRHQLLFRPHRGPHAQGTSSAALGLGRRKGIPAAGGPDRHGGKVRASTSPRTNRSRTSAVRPPGICAGPASKPNTSLFRDMLQRALRAGFSAALCLGRRLVRVQGEHRLLSGQQTDRHLSNEARALSLSLPRTHLHGSTSCMGWSSAGCGPPIAEPGSRPPAWS